MGCSNCDPTSPCGAPAPRAYYIGEEQNEEQKTSKYQDYAIYGMILLFFARIIWLLIGG